MFNAGRILRNLNRRESLAPGRTSFLATPPVVKKEKRKFRCYVPFVWQALTATCLGLIVIVVGVGLCVVGYYADRFRPSSILLHNRRTDNDTASSSAWMDDEAKPRDGGDGASAGSGGGYNHLRTLIYIGPALMSCGSFAIVFSCVVVCEMRDKVLEMMDEREKLLGSAQRPKHHNIKLDFFQSVVYPQHNRPRPGQKRPTPREAPADQFPSCAVDTSGSGGVSGPALQMTELRPSDGPSPVPAPSQAATRACCPVSSTGTLRPPSCPRDVAPGPGGSTLARPTIPSGTSSIDESELVRAARRRSRYSSEPLLPLNHHHQHHQGRHRRTSAGVQRWCPAAQGTSAVLLVAEDQGRAPERTPCATGQRLLIARVQGISTPQRPQQRVSARRLLVSRKPIVRGGQGTGFHTSSVEVLIGRDDANRDEAVFPDGDLNPEGSFGHLTAPLGAALPRPSQVRLKAVHLADPPPNVLVHQAYVHAEPDRGTPVTALLPPTTSISLFGTTSRMTSPPSMTSPPIMTSPQGVPSSSKTPPLQLVASPPGLTSSPGVSSQSSMTSLPRMTTAFPHDGKSSSIPHRLSLPSGDSSSHSGLVFSSMQMAPNRCTARRMIIDQRQHHQQQYQQPVHEHHQSQKMRVEAAGTSSVKDFC